MSRIASAAEPAWPAAFPNLGLRRDMAVRNPASRATESSAPPADDVCIVGEQYHRCASAHREFPTEGVGPPTHTPEHAF